jgi:hypothetical protein
MEDRGRYWKWFLLMQQRGCNLKKEREGKERSKRRPRKRKGVTRESKREKTI